MSETNKIRVRVGFAPTDHLNLRALAGQNGMSMSAYCEAVILEAIRQGHMVERASPLSRPDRAAKRKEKS